MKFLSILLLSVFAVTAFGVGTAPTASADGFYVGGSYATGGGGSYWDPSCGCWVYPTYSYRPYTYYPTYYGYYGYPQYSYPYYSRPSYSFGFSYGTGSRYGGYGGYGHHWHR